MPISMLQAPNKDDLDATYVGLASVDKPVRNRRVIS